MAAPGVVRIHEEEKRVTFLVEGQGTMHLSPCVRRHAEAQLAGGAASLTFDLRGCTYLDSTFLGTLVALKRSAACQVPACDFALICPSAECRQLFKQMWFEGVFRIATAAAPPSCDCHDLPPDSHDVSAFKHNIVQAHQELAELAGPAGDPFRALAARMTKELNAEKHS